MKIHVCVLLSLLLFLALGCAGDDDDSAPVPPDDDADDDDMSDDDADDDADDDTWPPLPDDDADDDADDDTTPVLPPPILDEAGRTLILHGGNFMAVGYGGAPIDYERMRDWGFNVVRILMTWAALEPTRGDYDEAYLPDVVEPQVEYAANAGLRVILDLHHFHWSSCSGGMGWPDWTCETPPDWVPADLEYLWQSGKFWERPDDVAAFVAAWEQVATHFAGDARVFAYDLFNEPLAGIRTPPWLSENQLMRPLYADTIEAIRAIDPAPYIALEPMMLSVVGFPFVMEPLPYDRLIYAPHLYPRNIVSGDGYNFDRHVLEWQTAQRAGESAGHGMPLLWGETGLQSAATRASEYARDFADLADVSLASWAWWAFGYDDDSMGLCRADGTPKDEFFPHLARPYPRVTGGQLREFAFDAATGTLTVTFDTIAGIDPTLEIFVDDEYFYAGGFDVTSTDADDTWSYSFDDDANSLTMSADPLADSHTIWIEPAI
ncbi:MAG: cellulase family glycosylhydrolase [Deltaproteobacteria bacterium]|nr:cellulase family glycosylhydrolase [Deltaproteobacteria bacterium]